MQIVIDIDEDTYNQVSNNDAYVLSEVDYILIENAIANGTPLPKGHGRIADMDEAIKCIGEVKGEDAKWAIGLIEWACDKRTIIEADRGDEE